MIDSTTLPKTAPGPLNQETKFVISGSGFNKWPDEIVCSYAESRILNGTLYTYGILKMISKTDTQLVFEPTISQDFATEHSWMFFGTPNNIPRNLLEYKAIPPIQRNLNNIAEIREEMR